MNEKEINYKKLWFELCEEKNQLQTENFRLKSDNDYFRKRCESLERIHNEIIQRKRKKAIPNPKFVKNKDEVKEK